MNNRGFVLLAITVAQTIQNDWYWAMKIDANEKVFDKLRQDIKGDRFAMWCELIDLYLANRHNTVCANPMALLKKLEYDKENGIMEEINYVNLNC